MINEEIKTLMSKINIELINYLNYLVRLMRLRAIVLLYCVNKKTAQFLNTLN